MAKTRKRYEPPVAYDISGAVSGDVHAQVCKSGANPSGASCKYGGMAGGECKTGNLAGARCEDGHVATSGRCKAGGVVTV